MVALAVLVCLRLGLWQWHRTHEADGTVQNLGYTILWPVFGGAFIYMWLRFLQLEVLKDAEDDDELTQLAAGGVDQEPIVGPVATDQGQDRLPAVDPIQPNRPASADAALSDRAAAGTS